MYYYGARYYDPTLRRFITPDTFVQNPYDPQFLNRYAYCRNNPINFVDPSGYFTWKEWFTEVGSTIWRGFWEKGAFTDSARGIAPKGLSKEQEAKFAFTALSGATGGISGYFARQATLSVMSSTFGQKYTERFSRWMQKAGLPEDTANFLSNQILSGFTEGFFKSVLTPKTPGRVVSPDELSPEQAQQYNDIANDSSAVNETYSNGRTVGQMPERSWRALVADDKVVAIIANGPILGIPFFPLTHTAVAIPGGGNFNQRFYLGNGVCHQGRVTALRSIGVNMLPTQLGNLDSYLTYGIYGTGSPPLWFFMTHSQ